MTLGEHYERFIDDKVAEGRFATADDVIRAGLRLLEEEEAKLGRLRQALIEGEASGPSTPFDFDAFLDRKRAEAKGG